MLPIVVAELEKDRGQSDRRHHDDCQRAGESAAPGVNHNQTKPAAKQGGGNHGPAARVESAVGHEVLPAFIQGFKDTFKQFAR